MDSECDLTAGQRASTPTDRTLRDEMKSGPSPTEGEVHSDPGHSLDDSNLLCNEASTSGILLAQEICPHESTFSEDIGNRIDPLKDEEMKGHIELTLTGLRGELCQNDTTAGKKEEAQFLQQTLPRDVDMDEGSSPGGSTEAADKTLMEHLDSGHGDLLCSDSDVDLEEVVCCSISQTEAGSLQERTNRPCGCFEDCVGQPPVVLKAWETPSEKRQNLHVHVLDPRCIETCENMKSILSGGADHSQSDEEGSFRVDNGLINAPSTCTSPEVEKTNMHCTCSSHENPTQNTCSRLGAVLLNNCYNEVHVTAPSEGDTSTDYEAPSPTQEAMPFRIFDELPHELFFKILGYFSIWELCVTISPVCKAWREYSKSPVLWQHVDLSENRDIGHNQLCAVLARVPLLKSLSLRGREQLCISELRMLGGCPFLTRLNLGFCDKVNGRILDEIVRCCPNLEAINLEGCEQIDDDVASQFPVLACLKVLNLSHCTKLTDDGIVLISQGCLLLEELNVDGIPWITDRAVKLLASERSLTLRAVYLDGAELTDMSIRYLMDCQFLTMLSLSFCEQLTDMTLSMLQTLNHLTYLRLKRGLEFSEEALCHFFECGHVEHLTFLDLSECPELMNKGVTSIAHRCPELRNLSLCWCWNVSDVGIEEIVQCCSQLRVLDIIGLDKIRGQCLASIPDALPRLILLDLRQCNLINDSMLVDLVKAKPHLNIFNYYGEEVTPDMIL